MFGALALVVLVIADRFGADSEMVQELPRVARVFAGDQVNFAQHTQRALSDVFQIPNRCGDDVKRTRHPGGHCGIASKTNKSPALRRQRRGFRVASRRPARGGEDQLVSNPQVIRVGKRAESRSQLAEIGINIRAAGTQSQITIQLKPKINYVAGFVFAVTQVAAAV